MRSNRSPWLTCSFLRPNKQRLLQLQEHLLKRILKPSEITCNQPQVLVLSELRLLAHSQSTPQASSRNALPLSLRTLLMFRSQRRDTLLSLLPRSTPSYSPSHSKLSSSNLSQRRTRSRMLRPRPSKRAEMLILPPLSSPVSL